jgi:hypothetical protein
LITLDQLKQHHDFDASNDAIRAAIATASADQRRLVGFLSRYVDWNGYFGCGVACLAGKIGRCRTLFLDPDEAVPALADRSVHVASYFFDAARDEFDDSATAHRDSHRTLAQATIRGVLDYYGIDDEEARELAAEPAWLAALNAGVSTGYGLGTPDDRASVFRAMGYHLGSEVLADEEFTILDKTLRKQCKPLVRDLLQRKVSIAGQEHIAYYWIGIHSGHGGGVEADHFEWALEGARRAVRYTDDAHDEEMEGHMVEGFKAFAADHTAFFAAVNT